MLLAVNCAKCGKEVRFFSDVLPEDRGYCRIDGRPVCDQCATVKAAGYFGIGTVPAWRNGSRGE